MSCGMQWLALLPPQQNIPRLRLGAEAYIIATYPLIARLSQLRMT